MNPTHKKIAKAVKKLRKKEEDLDPYDPSHAMIYAHNQALDKVTKDIADILEEEAGEKRVRDRTPIGAGSSRKIMTGVHIEKKFNRKEFEETAGVQE